MHTIRKHSATARPLRRAALGLPTLAVLAACSNLLEVQYPGRIPTEQLDNPALAAVLADGVVGDLECAYNNYFSGSAAHSDEFESSSDNGILANAGERNITADNTDYADSGCEASSINTAGDFGLQIPMHTARFQAEDVYSRLGRWTDEQVAGRIGLQAKVRAYGAYAYTFFGETYCTFAKDGNPPGPPSDPLNIAATQFADAIQLAQQANDPSLKFVIDMSRVGLARVNMNLKKWPEAKTNALLVPPGFELFASRGTENDRRWNKMTYLFNQLGAFVISNPYRQMKANEPNDPRLGIEDAGRGAFNPPVRLWIQTKHTGLGQPIRLASYREAQLILAEAEAELGNVGAAMAILNARRQELNLTDLQANDKATAISRVIDERQRELAFEGGHRLNDLLRRSIPWKVAGTSNPFTNRPYGATTCWPTPSRELNGK
jgi:hypothetical protein